MGDRSWLPALAAGVALTVGIGLGWYLHSLFPADLIEMGARWMVQTDAGLRAEIAAYEVADRQLREQLDDARTRERDAALRVAQALLERDAARIRVAEADAAKPGVDADLDEAGRIVEVPVTVACEVEVAPFRDMVVILRRDVNLERERVAARDDELAALNRAFVARNVEMTALREQLEWQTDRLEAADRVVRKAKRGSRRVKLAGLLALGAGVYLAVR